MNYFEQLERTLGPEYTEGELVCWQSILSVTLTMIV